MASILKLSSEEKRDRLVTTVECKQRAILKVVELNGRCPEIFGTQTVAN